MSFVGGPLVHIKYGNLEYLTVSQSLANDILVNELCLHISQVLKPQSEGSS